MRDLDDDTLLSRASAGDTAAFGILVRRHQELLIAFAARMLGGDMAAGEDVAQEALLRLWHTRQSWQPEGRLRSWLIRTTFRLCLDEKRRPTPLELEDKLQATATPDLELGWLYAQPWNYYPKATVRFSCSLPTTALATMK